MLNKFVPILVATSLLLMLAPACQKSDGILKQGNKVGNIAYDFSLKDLNGNTVTLSGLAGRPVVVNFWLTT